MKVFMAMHAKQLAQMAQDNAESLPHAQEARQDAQTAFTPQQRLSSHAAAAAASHELPGQQSYIGTCQNEPRNSVEVQNTPALTWMQPCRGEWDCPFCLEQLCRTYRLQCGHHLCRGCLLQQYEQYSRCPLCREYMSPGKSYLDFASRGKLAVSHSDAAAAIPEVPFTIQLKPGALQLTHALMTDRLQYFQHLSAPTGPPNQGHQEQQHQLKFQWMATIFAAQAFLKQHTSSLNLTAADGVLPENLVFLVREVALGCIRLHMPMPELSYPPGNDSEQPPAAHAALSSDLREVVQEIESFAASGWPVLPAIAAVYLGHAAHSSLAQTSPARGYSIAAFRPASAAAKRQ